MFFLSRSLNGNNKARRWGVFFLGGRGVGKRCIQKFRNPEIQGGGGGGARVLIHSPSINIMYRTKYVGSPDINSCFCWVGFTSLKVI